jgi:hypothetical protein
MRCAGTKLGSHTSNGLCDPSGLLGLGRGQGRLLASLTPLHHHKWARFQRHPPVAILHRHAPHTTLPRPLRGRRGTANGIFTWRPLASSTGGHPAPAALAASARRHRWRGAFAAGSQRGSRRTGQRSAAMWRELWPRLRRAGLPPPPARLPAPRRGVCGTRTGPRGTLFAALTRQGTPVSAASSGPVNAACGTPKTAGRVAPAACWAASHCLEAGGLPPAPPGARIPRGQKDAGTEVPSTVPTGSCLPRGRHARAVQGRRALRGCLVSPGAVVGGGPSLRPRVIARQDLATRGPAPRRWRSRWARRRPAWPGGAATLGWLGGRRQPPAAPAFRAG